MCWHLFRRSTGLNSGSASTSTQIGEGDLVRWCEKCLPWIGEVQVADNPGRCEPGTGEINFAVIARALHKMGYSGPVGLEAYAAGEAEFAIETFSAAFTI